MGGKKYGRENYKRRKQWENGIFYWKPVPPSSMPTEKKEKCSSSTFWSRSVGLPKPWPPIETDNRWEAGEREKKKWQIKDSQVGAGVLGGNKLCSKHLAGNKMVMVECKAGTAGILGSGWGCNWGAQREEHNTTMHEKWAANKTTWDFSHWETNQAEFRWEIMVCDYCYTK